MIDSSMHQREKGVIEVSHRVHEADETGPMFGVLRIERREGFTTTGSFVIYTGHDASPDFLREIARHALALRHKLVARRKGAEDKVTADIVAEGLADHRVDVGFEDDAPAEVKPLDKNTAAFLGEVLGHTRPDAPAGETPADTGPDFDVPGGKAMPPF